MSLRRLALPLTCAAVLLAGCPKSNAGNGPSVPKASASASAVAVSAAPSAATSPRLSVFELVDEVALITNSLPAEIKAP